MSIQHPALLSVFLGMGVASALTSTSIRVIFVILLKYISSVPLPHLLSKRCTAAIRRWPRPWCFEILFKTPLERPFQCDLYGPCRIRVPSL